MAFDLLARTPREQIATIFIAYFGRAPDPVGLNFWVGQRNAALQAGDRDPSGVLADIAESFKQNVDSAPDAPDNTEGVAFDLFRFPNIADTAVIAGFVDRVFRNLFNRPAEGTAEDTDTGLGFWTQTIQARLQAGEPVGDVIVDIAAGAQGDDADVLTNKIAAGLAYAEAFVTTDGASFEVAEDRASAVRVVRELDAGSGALAQAMAAARTAAQDDAGASAAPRVTLAPADGRVAEGESLTYTVTLRSDIAADLDLTLATRGAALEGAATAAAGNDVVLDTHRVGFSGGSGDEAGAQARVTLAALADSRPEATEGLRLAVLDADGTRLTRAGALIQNVSQGRRFELGPGADTLAPNVPDPTRATTPGADTIAGAASGTLGDGDVIDGGGGADAVTAPLDPASAGTIAPTLRSIGELRLDATDGAPAAGGTAGFDARNSTGLETVTVANLGDADPFAGDSDKVDRFEIRGIEPTVTVRVRDATNSADVGEGSDLDLIYSGVAGGGDAATVALTGAALGDDPSGSVGGGNGLRVPGIETLTLKTGGSTGNRIERLDAPAAQRLVVTGPQALTIHDALAAGAGKLRTVDAAAAAGGVDLTLGAMGAPVAVTGGDGADVVDAGSGAEYALTARGGAGDDVLTGGAGDDRLIGGPGVDSLTVGAGADVVSGGPGGDTIRVAGNLTSADRIDGGPGSDALLASAAELDVLEANAAAQLSALTSIEALGVTDELGRGDGTLDVSAFGELGRRVVLQRAETTADATLKGLQSGATVQIQEDASFATNDRIRLEIPGATAAGSNSDAITIASAIDFAGKTRVANFAVPGIETVNVVNQDPRPTTGGADDQLRLELEANASLDRINISGNRGSIIKAGSNDFPGLETVDANGTTAPVRVDLGGSFGGTEGVTLRGGRAQDFLRGTDFADVLVGNGGPDSLSGRLGTDRMTGGGGSDVFRFGRPDHFGDRVTDFTSGTDRVALDVDPSPAFADFVDVASTFALDGPNMASTAGVSTTVLVNVPVARISAAALLTAADGGATVRAGGLVQVYRTFGGATTRLRTETITAGLGPATVFTGFSGADGFTAAILAANDTGLTPGSATLARRFTARATATAGPNTTPTTAAVSFTLTAGGATGLYALGLSTGSKVLGLTITKTGSTLTSGDVSTAAVETIVTLSGVTSLSEGDIIIA